MDTCRDQPRPFKGKTPGYALEIMTGIMEAT
ncbi:MAG: hypothetical protein Ct9H300mP8_12590 [Gammaproteobacteria bacterium]|nr:MAG: hypothetical protein Ct9H300mP8_12590 [Gammaproteobacteria bacterium]